MRKTLAFLGFFPRRPRRSPAARAVTRRRWSSACRPGRSDAPSRNP